MSDPKEIQLLAEGGKAIAEPGKLGKTALIVLGFDGCPPCLASMKANADKDGNYPRKTSNGTPIYWVDIKDAGIYGLAGFKRDKGIEIHFGKDKVPDDGNFPVPMVLLWNQGKIEKILKIGFIDEGGFDQLLAQWQAAQKQVSGKTVPRVQKTQERLERD